MTTNIYPSAAAAEAEVIWEWNRTDTTQFKPAINFDDFPNAGATTLTVVADGGIGNMLRFATTKAGTLAVFRAAIWLIDQSFPKIVGTNQYRYVVRARVVNVAFTGGVVIGYGGFAYMCSDAGGAAQYGFISTIHPTANTNGRARIEAGAVQTNGSTGVIGSPPDLIPTMELVGFHNAGNPDFSHAMWSIAAGSVIGDSYREAAIGAGAFGAGWGAQTLDRIGLALFESPVGAAGTITLDITDMYVLRYPID